MLTKKRDNYSWYSI